MQTTQHNDQSRSQETRRFHFTDIANKLPSNDSNAAIQKVTKRTHKSVSDIKIVLSVSSNSHEGNNAKRLHRPLVFISVFTAQPHAVWYNVK